MLLTISKKLLWLSPTLNAEVCWCFSGPPRARSRKFKKSSYFLNISRFSSNFPENHRTSSYSHFKTFQAFFKVKIIFHKRIFYIFSFWSKISQKFLGNFQISRFSVSDELKPNILAIWRSDLYIARRKPRIAKLGNFQEISEKFSIKNWKYRKFFCEK